MAEGPTRVRHGPDSPLCTPLFLGALTLLVLNDHWLKGANAAPPWLTGKLSDLAGLIVAPVVAAELWRGRLAVLRLPAAASVVLLFIAAQVSPPVARGIEATLDAIGVRSRLWSDPSDLVALCVLPLTWALVRRNDGARTRTALPRVLLGAALIACVATSDPPSYVHGPFLVNHSGGALELTATWARARVSCNTPLETVAAGLVGSKLDPPHALALEPSQVARLSPAPAPHDTPVGRCTSYAQLDDEDDAGRSLGECIALRLSGAGLDEHVVRAPAAWRRDDEDSRCATSVPVYEDPGEGALVVGRSQSGALRLIPHRHIELLRMP